MGRVFRRGTGYVFVLDRLQTFPCRNGSKPHRCHSERSEERSFGGVYPELAEGPQDDTRTQSVEGDDKKACRLESRQTQSHQSSFELDAYHDNALRVWFASRRNRYAEK